MTEYDLMTIQSEQAEIGGVTRMIPIRCVVDLSGIKINEMTYGGKTRWYFHRDINGKPVSISLGKINIKGHDTYFLNDHELWAYTHWIDMFHDHGAPREAVVKIISGSNLMRFYEETDFEKSKRPRLLYYDDGLDMRKPEPMPQIIKDDVNIAYKKQDAKALISKYFGQKGA